MLSCFKFLKMPYESPMMPELLLSEETLAAGIISHVTQWIRSQEKLKVILIPGSRGRSCLPYLDGYTYRRQGRREIS